jgi:AmmeMemoRadiSam system protein B
MMDLVTEYESLFRGTMFVFLLRNSTHCSFLSFTHDPYLRILVEKELRNQIESWMKTVDKEDVRVKAIIAPHAGYAYSGPTMAYAYKHINPNTVRRIFVLGPSHHFYSKHCHLSECVEYETPLGSMTIDQTVYNELKRDHPNEFPPMSTDDDEAEHSIEMHLPYIVSMMKDQTFTIVPILVGALSPDAEATYGNILAPYLAADDTIFIISSDFCHWGRRFGYQFHRPEDQQIHESIAWLDSEGMKAIEKKDPHEFYTYLKAYENTICGRHPIGVLLQALSYTYKNKESYQVRFTKYDRSNLVYSASDSSVSYASAVVSITPSS